MRRRRLEEEQNASSSLRFRIRELEAELMRLHGEVVGARRELQVANLHRAELIDDNFRLLHRIARPFARPGEPGSIEDVVDQVMGEPSAG